MTRSGRKALPYVIAMLGAGNGLLLGRGLELCFGVNRYLMIMLFGGLAGAGFALIYWLAQADLSAASSGRKGPGLVWRTVAACSLPALAVFAVYFLWRVLPLIREEIQYYR